MRELSGSSKKAGGKAVKIREEMGEYGRISGDGLPEKDAGCLAANTIKIIFQILLTNRKIHAIITEACE